ncbi:MAG: hypothetical protein AAB855_00055 [Patescibacteria group bacterium]
MENTFQKTFDAVPFFKKGTEHKRTARVEAAIVAALSLSGCVTPETFVLPGYVPERKEIVGKSFELTSADREKTAQTPFRIEARRILEKSNATEHDRAIFEQESQNSFVHLAFENDHYLAPLINERIWFKDKEVRLHCKTPLRLIEEGYLTPSQWQAILDDVIKEASVRFALPARATSLDESNLSSQFVPTIEGKHETVGIARLAYGFLPLPDKRFIVSNNGTEIELDEGDIIEALQKEEEDDPI